MKSLIKLLIKIQEIPKEEDNMNTIVLDDGIEYAIVREDVINGTEYTLFTNVNDNSKICFRKTVIEDGEEYYIRLDSDKEFDLVSAHFTKKLLKVIDSQLNLSIESRQ